MKKRRTLAVGLIGYGFMGKAHSNAWRQAPRFFDLPVELRMRTLCGRDARAVKEAAHPYVAQWWPAGHLLGYEHSFIHAVVDFVRAIVSGKKVAPDFGDGLANQRVLAAIEESARAKRWVKL